MDYGTWLYNLGNSSLAGLAGLTCATPRKYGQKALDAAERAIDHVDRTLDHVEKTLDEALDDPAPPPAWADCALTDRERRAGSAWFDKLLTDQRSPSSDVVVEDDKMLHLLAARQLVKPASPKAGSAPSWAPRLRDVSAGHWVGGESQQRCYSRDEWARLVQLLQSPQPLGEVRTLPDDDPLAVKALLLLPAAGVLLCACHNDSMLDALEHSLDPTAAVDRPAGDGARDAGALAVRPLGALLAYTAAGKAAGGRLSLIHI